MSNDFPAPPRSSHRPAEPEVLRRELDRMDKTLERQTELLINEAIQRRSQNRVRAGPAVERTGPVMVVRQSAQMAKTLIPIRPRADQRRRVEESR
jgi:hypothetical protein